MFEKLVKFRKFQIKPDAMLIISANKVAVLRLRIQIHLQLCPDLTHTSLCLTYGGHQEYAIVLLGAV